jgi:hypothetical protein
MFGNWRSAKLNWDNLSLAALSIMIWPVLVADAIYREWAARQWGRHVEETAEPEAKNGKRTAK